ncbi:MAG: sulfotransferase, partial [Anaerolineae bacterium]
MERLLGEIHGFVSTGEMRYQWEWGVRDNLLCACGAPVRECTFWTKVLQESVGSLGPSDIERIIQLKTQVERAFGAMDVLSPTRLAVHHTSNFKQYSEIMKRVYRAIASISHARVIVDSSKHAARGFLLAATPGIELHVVHLVRDSRAVAYSWQRRRIRPEVWFRREYMDMLGLWGAVAHWIGHNRISAALARYAQTYSLVRYEDLVADPAQALSAIVRQVGEPDPCLYFLAAGGAQLRSNHAIAGNPMRF